MRVCQECYDEVQKYMKLNPLFHMILKRNPIKWKIVSKEECELKCSK